MPLTLSDGELLLRTYRGRCGHRRQSGLPCATPGCREGRNIHMHAFIRRELSFGDERHYVWKRLPLEDPWDKDRS